jgi:hypothetical protein
MFVFCEFINAVKTREREREREVKIQEEMNGKSEKHFILW